MSEMAPLAQTVRQSVPAVTIAASTTTPLTEAPYAGTVTSASYTPAAAITGANTNTRIVRLVNKGAAGAGTTLIASVQFNSGINGVASDEYALTLTATVADRAFVEGDILAWDSSAVGTGLADPGGLAQVEMSRS